MLIVDDQYGIRILLQEVLRKAGYQTLLAANGPQAIELVSREKPRLVLLDMKIPGMDGLEILKKIKRMQPEMKVMIMTAYGELEIIQRAIKNGALTHFSKPFDIQELIDTVKKEVPLNENLSHEEKG
ncbi:response regulator [Sporolactobacillus sp. THM7-4]|nr:response regulator [Sporolactobacillus sp. THM7-4]